jgi:hypothetical protein
VATFSAWKVNFDKELSRKKALEDEERMKGLASKEREECKRLAMRLTGMSSPRLLGTTFT